MRLRALAVGIILLLSGVSALRAERVRRPRMTRAPRIGRPKPYQAPARVRFVLENGLKVVLVEDRRFPLVSLRMAVSGGTGPFARNTPGMLEAMASLLTEGTTHYTARQIAEEADSFGGAVTAEATKDHVIVSAFSLSDHLDRMLALAIEVIGSPSFPEHEVVLRKKNMLEELKLNRSQSSFLAEVAFSRRLYDPHPYGIVAPTEERIRIIDRISLVKLHERLFTVNNALLVVVGDIGREELEAKLNEAMIAWVSKPSMALWKLPGPKAKPAKRRVVLVDRPGSAQAVLRIGNLALKEDDPDYFPLLLANQVLGGSFAARLSADLREQKGYTYGIYSSLPAHRAAGAFVIAFQVRSEVVKPALEAVLAHLDRMSGASVRYQELRQAKRMLIGGFVRELETQEGLIDAVLHGILLDLPEDYLDSYVEKVQAVKAGDVRRAAQRFMRSGETLITVVGDAKILEGELASLSEDGVLRVDHNGLIP
ncbi:MAG: pitrilysin family protein [Elusimicrobiota bacterium]